MPLPVPTRQRNWRTRLSPAGRRSSIFFTAHEPIQPCAPVTKTRIQFPPEFILAICMKIKHISTAVMEANFDWTIVKVETDENITGYGEAFLGPGLTAVIRE